MARKLISFACLIFLNALPALGAEKDAEALTRRAYKHAWSGDHDRAAAEFNQVLSLKPDSRDALFGLASITYWQKKFPESRQIAERLLKQYPHDKEVLDLKKKIKSALKEENIWRLRLGYEAESLSYADNARGANGIIGFEKRKKWSVWSGFRYLNKFDQEAGQGQIGASLYLTSKTRLAVSGAFANSQGILPTHEGSLELTHALSKIFEPSIGYQFSHYQISDVHRVKAGLTVYLPHGFELNPRYDLSVNRLDNGRSPVNHSFSTVLAWSPSDRLRVSAGYARTNESFDPGGARVARFSANHFIGGLRWEFHKGVGLEASLDYEKRNDGRSVTAVGTGLLFRW